HLSPLALQRCPPVLFDWIEDTTRPELDLRAATAPGTLGEAISSVGRSAASSAAALSQLCADEGLFKLHSALRRAGMEAPPAVQLVERAMLRALELLQLEVGRWTSGVLGSAGLADPSAGKRGWRQD